MRVWAAAGLSLLAYAHQDPGAGGESASEVLLFMGIAMILFLAFGFVLLRRKRQRPVASAFDDHLGDGGEQSEDQQGVEHVL